MTDPTARVREELSRIAAGQPDDAVDAATLDAIWRAGSRRRWRARAGAVATLVAIALLVAGALGPSRLRRRRCLRHHPVCPLPAIPSTSPCCPACRSPRVRG